MSSTCFSIFTSLILEYTSSANIERERGITILSKNTAVYYKGVKINIIDTPGHADFGGEVERVLKMVNGVILVVDAFEGPMPQTRFVLSKAMALDLPVIVCINKIDRPGARPTQVIDEVLELLMDLGASDEQIDCPFVFASAKSGIATLDLGSVGASMKPLFETIIDYIPAPKGDPEAGTQMLISTIDYNEYVGRIGVGKVDNGTLKVNQECVIVNHHNPDVMRKVKISKLYEFSRSSSSGILRTISPCLMRRPSPSPPAMPISASLASPGPFTAQPMTATLILRGYP